MKKKGISIVAISFVATMVFGQTQAQNFKSEVPPPTHAEVVYGSHPRNVMDLWLVPSEKPTPLRVYMHGGEFSRGDKSLFSSDLIKDMNKTGIFVAYINDRFKEDGKSRFEGEDPLCPAILLDGARALQFLRYNAAKYNLDKTRFAAGGGSAGGQMLMWLGYHDDLAQPDHEDPALPEFTCLQVLAPKIGQTSMHGPTLLKWFGVNSLNMRKPLMVYGCITLCLGSNSKKQWMSWEWSVI